MDFTPAEWNDINKNEYNNRLSFGILKGLFYGIILGSIASVFLLLLENDLIKYNSFLNGKSLSCGIIIGSIASVFLISIEIMI